MKNYDIITYPDGTTYVQLHSLPIGGDVKMPEDWFDDFYDCTWRVNTYNDLWILGQYVEAVNHQGYTPTITIPWLIDGQADRRFAGNESVGLVHVCKFLNSLQANIEVFHPHNAEVVEALIEGVEILPNTFFIQEVFAHLYLTIGQSNYDHDNIVILCPDAGAYKWVTKLCNTLGWKGDLVSASKSRSKDGIITQVLPQYDFKNKQVLIIDDCCLYGGTFKGLAKLLDDQEIAEKYLAVSHMTLQNLGKNPVPHYFNTVFTTNSKYEQYAYNISDTVLNFVLPNLKVIKLF